MTNSQQLLLDGRLQQAQDKMLAMLKVVDEVCTRHKIDYWLDAGTLLGAVRHQDFIPWDDDLDIAMTRDNFERFLKIPASEFPKSIWLQTRHSDPGFFNMATPLKIRDKTSRYIEKFEQGNEPYVLGIFIDVFVYDKMPEKAWKRKLYKFSAKKLSRLLSHKYCKIRLGHYHYFYKVMSAILPKRLIEYGINRIIKKAHASDSPYWGRGYQCVGKNLVQEGDIYPLKKAKFASLEVNIPHNAEVFLTQQYGDYHVLPPEHQRQLRHCKELIPDWDGED